ncbi:hypothetical protein ACLOJK_005093 [Asimina triloba]
MREITKTKMEIAVDNSMSTARLSKISFAYGIHNVRILTELAAARVSPVSLYQAQISLSVSIGYEFQHAGTTLPSTLLSRFFLPAALTPFSLTCAALLPLPSPPSTLRPLPFSLACPVRFPILCPLLPYSSDRPSIFPAAVRFLSTIIDSGHRTKSSGSSIFHYLASLPSAIVDSGRWTRSSIFQLQRRILCNVYSDLPFTGNDILSSLPCPLLDLVTPLSILCSVLTCVLYVFSTTVNLLEVA